MEVAPLSGSLGPGYSLAFVVFTWLSVQCNTMGEKKEDRKYSSLTLTKELGQSCVCVIFFFFFSEERHSWAPASQSAGAS